MQVFYLLFYHVDITVVFDDIVRFTKSCTIIDLIVDYCSNFIQGSAVTLLDTSDPDRFIGYNDQYSVNDVMIVRLDQQGHHDD